MQTSRPTRPCNVPALARDEKLETAGERIHPHHPLKSLRSLLLIFAWLLAFAPPVSAHASLLPRSFALPPIPLLGVEFTEDDDPSPLTLHLDGLYDRAGPLSRVLVRQNPWSMFDPEGLNSLAMGAEELEQSADGFGPQIGSAIKAVAVVAMIVAVSYDTVAEAIRAPIPTPYTPVKLEGNPGVVALPNGVSVGGSNKSIALPNGTTVGGGYTPSPPIEGSLVTTPTPNLPQNPGYGGTTPQGATGLSGTPAGPVQLPNASITPVDSSGLNLNVSHAEGVYEFPDQTAGGKPYTGETADKDKRLKQHEKAGRYVPGTETFTPVPGGKTAREIAEHERIQQNSNGVPAAQSPNVANRKDPIGPKRQHLLKKDP